MLDVIKLKKKFKENIVLNDVSFNVKKGEIVAYLGPNGAGKTTTIKCVCGLNTLTGGRVELNNHTIGVVFDENGLYPLLTAYENLLFFAKLSGNKSVNIEEMLRIVGLEDVVHKRGKKFSKGMKRRVALARVLVWNPQILILDEPFDGLDVSSHNYMINFLKNWVKENNRCIMFSSHNMSEIDNFCDRVIILNGGKIITDDTVHGLLKRNILGTDVCIRHESDMIKSMEILVHLTNRNSIQSNGNNIFIPHRQAYNKEIHDLFVKNNIAFDELSVRYASLEDIYLNLIRGEDYE
ncbi:MAG: ABC transporter ATP-binding protein [Clostridiales bacterium]|jgi:ABC-2 type transport system ATP-binding protein|nr:ABC transporter ATP-binding protein [Clostridiales bacterium]